MNQPSVATIKRLFALSGNNCAFPKCTQPTVDDTSEKVMGEVCHIRARRPGGPRFDETQSNSERHHFDNLLLLCPTHHNVVDADEESYTIERLLSMKQNHESQQQQIPEPSDKIATTLIQNIHVEGNVNPSIVISHNQSGGITAGKVTIDAAPEPKLSMKEVFLNQPGNGEYHTRLELMVDSPYPAGNLFVEVRAASIKRIDLAPQRSGVVITGHSGTRDGLAFTNLQSPYGRIFLEIFTVTPDRFEVVWDIQ